MVPVVVLFFVDVAAKLRQVEEKDPAVHIQLLSAHAFGLRTEEAIVLQPNEADQCGVLVVIRGTKGGRRRQTPIEDPYQREVLARAKTLARGPNGATIPDGAGQYTLKRWLNRYYYVLRCCAIRVGPLFPLLFPWPLLHPGAATFAQE